MRMRLDYVVGLFSIHTELEGSVKPSSTSLDSAISLIRILNRIAYDRRTIEVNGEICMVTSSAAKMSSKDLDIAWRLEEASFGGSMYIDI